jgi:HK97 family phage portal protein
MRNPFRRRTETSEITAGGESRTLSAQTAPALMSEFLPNKASITARNALQIADAWSCIRALADAAASLPLHTFRKTPQGRIEVEGRGAELLQRPAPSVTTSNLIHQVLLHLNLYGNCYVGKFRSAGEIIQLGLLHPERVQPRIDPGGIRRYVFLDDKNRRLDLGTDDVVHIRAMSLDGLVGLSPIQQCRAALGLSKDLTEHSARFFSQDARPGGILSLDVGTDMGDFEKWASAWQTHHTGASNAHKIAMVTGDVSFTPVSMPHRDSQFIESRQLSTLEVCRIFRIPPWVIGADSGESMTYSNTEQQSLHFAVYSLTPWLRLIEQALSADKDLFPGNAYCEFELSGLLRADAKSRAETYRLALDPAQGWMTRAEVRELENLPPEETPPIATTSTTNGAGNPENVPMEVGNDG